MSESKLAAWSQTVLLSIEFSIGLKHRLGGEEYLSSVLALHSVCWEPQCCRLIFFWTLVMTKVFNDSWFAMFKALTYVSGQKRSVLPMNQTFHFMIKFSGADSYSDNFVASEYLFLCRSCMSVHTCTYLCSKIKNIITFAYLCWTTM